MTDGSENMRETVVPVPAVVVCEQRERPPRWVVWIELVLEVLEEWD